MTDVELAAAIARQAGQILMALRAGGLFAGRALGTAGDHVANTFIMAALREHRPDDAILSEEEKDDPARLAASRVWIVDPLDGTREYGEGRDDWAVHIALAIDGEAMVGAVALPAEGLVFTSADPAPPTRPPHDPPRMVVSRTRSSPEVLAVAQRLGATLVPMGSAGAKAMAVVRGQADIYLHSGGQYEWDSCAPVAVAQAAGLHVSRADGAALRYNAADVYLPDLLVCAPGGAARVLNTSPRG